MDALPFPDALLLADYWIDNPPAHILMRRFMGYEKRTPAGESSRELTEADEAFLADAERAGVRPFETLPPAVQRAIKESKG